VTSPKEELSGAKLTQTSGKSRFTKNRSGKLFIPFRKGIFERDVK
jgi:hypothetical protein